MRGWIEAIVRWGAATMIERTNPIPAALAEAMQITEAQLDALFGIAWRIEERGGLAAP